MGLSIGLAILAALANATSAVLQRRANRDEPDRKSLSWRMILDLFHRPVWFAGLAVVITGFLLQAVALRGGRIAIVQPILSLELPFVVVLSSIVFSGPPRPTEWLLASAMAGGLVLLLASLAPTPGTSVPVRPEQWVVGILINLAVVAFAIWRGKANRYGRRAAYFGAAAGMSFGLTAALMTSMNAAFARAGLVGAVTTWETYLMVAAGLLSMFLLQNALQAGRLVTAQPSLTLCDPVVSIVWGVVVFEERIRLGWWLAGALAGAAVIVAATIKLSRSPILHGATAKVD